MSSSQSLKNISHKFPQLLHEGKTPWDAYFALGDIRLALVIADNRSKPEFDRHQYWDTQVQDMRKQSLEEWEEMRGKRGNVFLKFGAGGCDFLDAVDCRCIDPVRLRGPWSPPSSPFLRAITT